MSFSVTTAGDQDEPVIVDHTDAVSVVVEDGHLVLRSTRGIVGIYAPGRWKFVVEARESSRGRRAALPQHSA